MMKLKDAFQRLKFTISKQNKTNETDVEAFNIISKYFQLHQTEINQENLLFAKLYSYLLCEFLNHYTDLNFANKEINRILRESIDIRTQTLFMKIKEMELRNYFNQKDVLDPFLKTKTVSELEEIHEKYKDKIPELNADEFKKVTNQWDIERVTYNLESNINLSIQYFKNNV